MPELQRDNWDKFDIISKFLGTVVFVAIPIVIGYSADSISQSIERGQLIQSLTEQLATIDTKRDIALIALDSAIPEKEKCTLLWTWRCENNLEPKVLEEDRVLSIAELLTERAILVAKNKGRVPDISEINVAKKIIIHRTNSNYYDDKFQPDIDDLNSLVPSAPNLQSSKEERVQKANISELLAVIQTPIATPKSSRLNGVKLVYIQYRSAKTKAEMLQTALQQENISTPGIEKVEKVQGISKNDIRYADKADLRLAQNLRDFLKNRTGIQIQDKDLIDLSTKGYRVPSGQLEIWLKD
jgi:hypothetical protein